MSDCVCWLLAGWLGCLVGSSSAPLSASQCLCPTSANSSIAINTNDNDNANNNDNANDNDKNNDKDNTNDNDNANNNANYNDNAIGQSLPLPYL